MQAWVNERRIECENRCTSSAERRQYTNAVINMAISIYTCTNVIFFGFTLIRDFLVSHVCINAALILLDSSLNTFQTRQNRKCQAKRMSTKYLCDRFVILFTCINFPFYFSIFLRSFDVFPLNSWSFFFFLSFFFILIPWQFTIFLGCWIGMTQAKLNQTKPNQAKPSPAKPGQCLDTCINCLSHAIAKLFNGKCEVICYWLNKNKFVTLARTERHFERRFTGADPIIEMIFQNSGFRARKFRITR